MTAHHDLGPSTWERLWHCPGSAALNATLPQEPDSVYSWEGTCAHALLERCVQEQELDASAFLSLPMEAKGRTFVVTKEHVDGVQVALDLFRKLAGTSAEFWAETKVNLSIVYLGLFGTTDVVVFDYLTKTLHVIDYKHGAGKTVEVEGNKQTRAYALGALQTFKELKPQFVTCWIVQPRKPHADGPVRSETYDTLDLYDFAEEARAKLAETQRPGAPRVPGDWCTFCRAANAMACPEFKDGAVAAASNAFGLIAEPTQFNADELAQRLEKVPHIRAYLKKLEAFAEREAFKGNLPTGWNWYAGRASRSWAKPDGEIIEAFRLVGDITETSLKSVAEVEKMIGKAAFANFANLVNTVKSPKLEKEAPGKTPIPLDEVQQRNKADAFSTIETPTE